jgi:Kef-type K+ transport system membrane component KefB
MAKVEEVAASRQPVRRRQQSGSFPSIQRPWPATFGSVATHSNILHDIGLCVIGALPFGLLARLLRQPPLLGYIAAGVCIGPHLGFKLIEGQNDIAAISELGLVLLMFLIGAEIDLKKLLAAGPAVVWGGLLQLPLCAVFHLAILWVIPGLGGGLERGYLALLLSLSSTAIVVKLLYEQSELDTLPGRVTLGVLVMQDLWAIVMLVLQPQLEDLSPWPLVKSLLLGLALVAVVLLTGKFALPPLFRWVSRTPELTLLLALAWCVAAAGGSLACGLSKEMGALLAGITISTFPVSLEVVTRILSIRDFFVTLFFVALGLQIPAPTWSVGLGALGCALLVILGRGLVVVPLIRAFTRDNRTAVVTAVNLAQVSEFSLVIAALGLALGHVRPETVGLVTFAMGATAVLSPYLLSRSHRIHKRLDPLLQRLGWRAERDATDEQTHGHGARVLLLGCYRIGRALVDEWLHQAPDRKGELLVVDFSPEALQFLRSRGIRAVFGDLTNLDLIAHLQPEQSEVILCTLTDSILKGSNNRQMLAALKRMAPKARIIVTAERTDEARELFRAGAAYVLMPYVSSGVEVVAQLLQDSPEAHEAQRCEQFARAGRLG